MTDIWTLQALADLAAVVSIEQQRHLGAHHADTAPSFDPGDGTVTLSSSDSSAPRGGEGSNGAPRGGGRRGADLVCEAMLLGAVTPDRSLWRWSWGDFEGFPEHTLTAARQVRDVGTEHGVAEFVAASLPFSEGLPMRLTLAAKAATGRYTHCSFTGLDGSEWWALIGHPSFDLPAPDARRIELSITEAIADGGIDDPAAAIASYARLRGIEHRLAGDDALLLEAADGGVLVRFDERLQVAAITRTPTGVDA